MLNEIESVSISEDLFETTNLKRTRTLYRSLRVLLSALKCLLVRNISTAKRTSRYVGCESERDYERKRTQRAPSFFEKLTKAGVDDVIHAAGDSPSMKKAENIAVLLTSIITSIMSLIKDYELCNTRCQCYLSTGFIEPSGHRWCFEHI
ncbi:hypothetical protein Tcan_08559 [Toxocara canis]|uniref:Uncharacterized protein n=1 Tax=Toxocara canis TaxID=6265 RepID=A0A0B2VBD9_TOXCA|nr:hypothetical protein Tcan_08559 [Toxocara canis]